MLDFYPSGLPELLRLPVVVVLKLLHDRAEKVKEAREAVGSPGTAPRSPRDPRYHDGVRDTGSSRMTTISFDTLLDHPELGEMAKRGQNIDQLLKGL